MHVPFDSQVVPLLERIVIMGLIKTYLTTTSELHLYKAPIDPITPEVLLADMVEADFDGYAALDPIVVSSVFLAPDGSAVVNIASHVFQATGSTTPNTIYGAYITTAAAAALVAVLPFTSPVGVANTGDAVPVAPQLHYSGT